jgi:mannose-1-phosphate guanylyltransferase / mannose-6-phosphate isomerase
MKVLILAGGTGEGLWPLSRKDYPKQFLEVNGRSFFYHTVKRFSLFSELRDIFVATTADYYFYVKNVLKGIGVSEQNIIVEPAARGTAGAIFYSVREIMKKSGISEDELIFVCPSDLFIKDNKKFISAVRTATRFAEQSLIALFGAEPAEPNTDYGYIQKGGCMALAGNRKCLAYSVKKFTEKPGEEKVAGMFREKNCLWNTGMMFFRISTIMDALKKHSPSFYRKISDIAFSRPEAAKKALLKLPVLSIDRAVLEKMKNGVVIPVRCGWTDVSSWNNFYNMFEKDRNGSIAIGDVISRDMKDSLIISEKNLIACYGMQDALIIGTDDAVLVSQRKHSSKVKDIVTLLKAKKRKEAIEKTTSYRPWGSYTVLEISQRYKIKKIIVSPKKSLSLQMHNHRSEHWVVIRGIARARIGEDTIVLQEGESTFVPVKAVHQLENPGEKPLEIIEVQMGDYVEEDDIVRLNDPYGRQRL